MELCQVCYETLEGILSPENSRRLGRLPPAELARTRTEENHPLAYEYAHHVDVEILRHSRSYCRVCSALENAAPTYPHLGVVTIVRFSKNTTGPIGPSILASFRGSADGEVLIDLYHHGDPLLPISKFPLSASTKSTESFAQLSAWMEDCLHTHDRCDLSSSSGFTPSRLLKLETRHSEKSISLVLRHECPPGTAYMTLSHCWGNQPATSKLRLSSDTLLILREGISLGTLPKTFRDAFHVIETLNFRYLWIDRLCIFQDSQEDWSRESSTMQDVYRHSSLNISAHAAFDDTDGCFFDRDGSVGRTPWLNINLGTAAIPQLYSVREFIPLTISEEFNEGPITCRGWILQERLLAPRVVHFGRKQLFWECMTSMCSETFPANLLDFSWDPPISSGRRHTWKHILDSNQTFILESDYEGPGRELFLDWDGLVRDFSLTKLTVPSDKLVAIAGLANDMKEKLRQERLLRRIPDDDSLRHFETYLAGIWNATLPMSLLWCVWGDRLPRPKYRAPSWSWASVDGNINPNDFFDYWGEEKQLVSVNHAEVIPLHDETGEVVDGTLNVTAPLAVYGLESSGLDKSQVKIKDLRSPLDLNNRQTLQGDNQYHHHIDFDTADDVFEELYCLPIVSSCFANLGLNVHGLVLKSVGAKFCRVGYFSIEARNKISGEVGTFIEKLPRTVVEII